MSSLLERRKAKKQMLAKQLFKDGGFQLRNSVAVKSQNNQSTQIISTEKPQLQIHQSQTRKKSNIQKQRFEQVYQIGEELGQGAHAVVKKCKKNANNKEYAVKIIRSNDEEIMIASKNCFRLQKLVQKNPLMCKTYELFIDEQYENIYQVMEFITWPSLHSVQQKFPNRQIPEDIAKNIIIQLCEAVKYMHELGICHRDLKPDNIMVDEQNNYQIKIIDFGIARKFLSKDPQNKYNILRHDMWSRTGTLCYKAPEMFSSASYTESCDIWSIGVIAYEILSGKLPFYEEYQTDTIEKIEECNYKFNDNGNFKWKTCLNAKDFIRRIFKQSNKRISVSNLLAHPWISKQNKSQKIKDDQSMKTSHAPVGFEMGKSTPAFELMRLQKTYMKKKDSGNNINTNSNGSGKNFIDQIPQVNPNPSHNNSGPGMTVSQIKSMAYEDVHIIKQKQFGGFMLSNNLNNNNSQENHQEEQQQDNPHIKKKSHCDSDEFQISNRPSSTSVSFQNVDEVPNIIQKFNPQAKICLSHSEVDDDQQEKMLQVPQLNMKKQNSSKSEQEQNNNNNEDEDMPSGLNLVLTQTKSVNFRSSLQSQEVIEEIENDDGQTSPSDQKRKSSFYKHKLKEIQNDEITPKKNNFMEQTFEKQIRKGSFGVDQNDNNENDQNNDQDNNCNNMMFGLAPPILKVTRPDLTNNTEEAETPTLNGASQNNLL